MAWFVRGLAAGWHCSTLTKWTRLIFQCLFHNVTDRYTNIVLVIIITSIITGSKSILLSLWEVVEGFLVISPLTWTDLNETRNISEWGSRCALGLHRISYPAMAPAEIRPNSHIRPYPAPARYGRRIWGRIWPSFDASASLCNWAGIRCFTNSVICTSLFHHGHMDHTHIFVSVCISLLVT